MDKQEAYLVKQTLIRAGYKQVAVVPDNGSYRVTGIGDMGFRQAFHSLDQALDKLPAHA